MANGKVKKSTKKKVTSKPVVKKKLPPKEVKPIHDKAPVLKLTRKMKAYCREWMVDRNKAAAARRSGYSEHTAAEQGYQLFQHPLVKAEIEKLEQEAAKRNDVTVDKILQNLNLTITRCLELTPERDPVTGRLILVKDDSSGQVAQVCRFIPQGVIAACKLLGDHLDMWKGKKDDGEMSVSIYED